MPSWCQSEASVRPPHLTDNTGSGESTGEIVSVCGLWPGVITRPAWCLVKSHGVSGCHGVSLCSRQ